MISKEEAFARLTDLSAALTPEERARATERMTLRSYRKNEVIYREGDTPDQLLCLVSGKVKVYKDGAGGRSQIVRVIDAVEYFGYRAAFGGQAYVTAAAAFEPSLIACVPISLVVDALEENARLAWFFIRRLSVLLGMSDERTVSLTQKHIRGRLAESILFLRDRYGVEEDGLTLRICPSREDMANLSNMTTSNAIRTMSQFVHERLIDVDGRRIRIADEGALRRVSDIG